MLAVSSSDYEKYGCVNCGCDFCYADGISGSTTPVICGECKTEFLVMNDNLSISTIGIQKERFNGLLFLEMSDGAIEIEKIGANEKKLSFAFVRFDNPNFVYPLPVKHPREGIKKHKFVRPDVRPDDGIGDFCSPRGVGYDLACFVKSKEAGERITEMINRINTEYDNKEFSCRLDYRENEPLWIQVKIDYPNREKAVLLEKLINDNGGIITEEIVRDAIHMKKPKVKEKDS